MKPIRYCSVTDCEQRCHSRGMCHMHYRRWTKTGDPSKTLKRFRGPDRCEHSGCDQGGPFRQGLCSLHYQRKMRHGDTSTVLTATIPTGPDHWAWVGDAAAYRTVHSRLDRSRGPAGSHACRCGSQAEQWAYDHADPEERWGTVSGGVRVPYSLDPAHYEALCLSCHRKMDGNVQHR